MGAGKEAMGMSKVDQVWQIFMNLQRQFPLWPSTFSTCRCGRGDGRGGGKCVSCIAEELAKEVGPVLAVEAVVALSGVQDVWARIREAVKE